MTRKIVGWAMVATPLVAGLTWMGIQHGWRAVLLLAALVVLVNLFTAVGLRLARSAR